MYWVVLALWGHGTTNEYGHGTGKITTWPASTLQAPHNPALITSSFQTTAQSTRASVKGCHMQAHMAANA